MLALSPEKAVQVAQISAAKLKLSIKAELARKSLTAFLKCEMRRAGGSSSAELLQAILRGCGFQDAKSNFRMGLPQEHCSSGAVWCV